MTQDRFKFRAWDGYLMLEQRVESFGMVTVLREKNDGYGESLSYAFGPRPHHDNKLIIMQSTGLKDKNGVLIFEGDIVVSIYQNYKHEIIFANACFMWGKLPLMVEDDEGVTLIEESSWCEVIGNIHDNPTLLKAEV